MSFGFIQVLNQQSMFIPPPGYQPAGSKQEPTTSAIRLQASHLLISNDIAREVFGGEQNARLVYYPDKRALMVAAASDELFQNLHKTSQHILKERNRDGDKSIALHEFLIDNQLDDTDRALTYVFQQELGILNISL